MNDAEIRTATRRSLYLQYQNDRDTVIFDELAVRHGSSRIDLAVVNGELHGFELKSEKDTLSRLPEQAEAFGRVFDRITLVVEQRHVRSAIDLVPDWWGIRVVHQEWGRIRFCDLKHSLKNPSPDPAAIVALLWRDEALQIFQELGGADGVRSKPRAEVYERLAGQAALNVLCDRVRIFLRRRPNWRSAATRLSCGD